MDEIKQVVLLDVRVQSEEAEKRSAEITSKLAEFKKEHARLKKQLESDTSNKQLAASLNAVDLQMRALNKEQGELRRQALLSNTAQTTQAGTIENLRAQLSLNTIEWNKLTVNERENTIQGKALAENTKKISDELKVLESTIGDTRRNVGNYKQSLTEVLNSSNGFTQSLNGMREMLVKIEAALADVDVNTDEYKQGKKAVDDLKLGIQQATGAVNEFGEREPRNPAKKAFEDAFQSAGALVSTLQLLTLVSGENEGAAKLQANAIRAVAVAQTVANITRSKGEIIDTIALAKTKLLTIAQRVYAVAVGQSTGALRVLRIAMLASVAGAVLIGIGLLAQKMGLFGKATKEANDEGKLFADIAKKISESVTEETTRLNALVKVARDETLSREKRTAAIKELNDISPEYLGNITLETIKTKEADEAIKAYLTTLEKKARGQAILGKVTETAGAVLDLEEKILRAQGALAIAALPGGEVLDEAGLVVAKKTLNNLLKEKEKLEAQSGRLVRKYEEEGFVIDEINERVNNLKTSTKGQVEATAEYIRTGQLSADVESLRAATIFELSNQIKNQIEAESEIADLRATTNPINSELLLQKHLRESVVLNQELRESENELTAARIEGIGQASSALSGLAQEGTRVHKILFLIQQGAAVAEVIFNTTKALSSITANLAAIPPLLPPGVPNPAYGFAVGVALAQAAKVKIQAGLSIGSILATTFGALSKKEKGGIEKLRKGKAGIFGGKPHSSGGTKGYFEDGTAVEVEEGELFAVVNKRDTKTLRSLSDLNSRHGVPFFKHGGTKFQDGGFAARYISQPVLNRFEARNQARLMAQSIPPQVVTVEDINAKVLERTRVVERANL